MTKKEALLALVEKLIGDEDVKLPDGVASTTASLLGFIADCVSVSDGAVQFSYEPDDDPNDSQE